MQGVRRVEYSKIELEPMYYSNDERFNNVQINKTLKVEDGVEEPIAIVEDKSNDKEELISVLRMVESPTIDLRGANRKVIVRPSHRVIERRGLALQKAPIRFPMVRVLASVVIIVGLLLVAGTLTLQQSLKYVSSDKTDINKKLQLANVASFFNF